MSEKPILIYSEYCPFSKKFLQVLIKYPDLFNSFIRMNIDINPQTKKRPLQFYQIQQSLKIKITRVPTLITPNGEQILSDTNAFKWLEKQIQLLTQNTELIPFNPNEMSSFSDNYSMFGSTDLCDAKEQNFRFFEDGELLNDNFIKNTDDWSSNKNQDFINGFANELETNTNNTVEYNNKQNERQFFDQQRQQYQQPKQYQQSKSNINFTGSQFGNISEKSKNMDMKLEELMNERKNIDDKLKQRQRNF